MSVKSSRTALRGGAGYDDRLPSMHPFMFVEHHEVLGDFGVIAFGAYNAFDLIGSEKGGVAVVVEAPADARAVVATKDIPWNPSARAAEVALVTRLVKSFLKPSKRDGKKVMILPSAHADEFAQTLQNEGYTVRGL